VLEALSAQRQLQLLNTFACSEDEDKTERPSKRSRTEAQSADTSRLPPRAGLPAGADGGTGGREVAAVGKQDIGQNGSRSSSATRILD